MSPLDIKTIEAVMKLMVKYRIDEYASGHFALKRSDHGPGPTRKPRVRKAVTTLEEEEPHTVRDPQTDENPDAPWESIPNALVERFAINGKLGT